MKRKSIGLPNTHSGASSRKRRCITCDRPASEQSNARHSRKLLRDSTRRLDILNSLPDSQSNLEQAFDIRLDLRPVLNPLGETRKSLERTREAEQIAERLDDNHRRGRVCCFITNSHSLAGDLDEALLSGTRALKLADQLNDLRKLKFQPRRIWSKRITGGVMTSA